jgi:hypothetical protein
LIVLIYNVRWRMVSKPCGQQIGQPVIKATPIVPVLTDTIDKLERAPALMRGRSL